MAELDLIVRKHGLQHATGPQTITLGAVARLRRMDANSRERERSVAVDIGAQGQRIDDLSAGTYEVQLLLPTGRTLTQQVTLGTEVERVTFDVETGSNSILAWQQFAGQVTPRVPLRRDRDTFEAGLLGAGTAAAASSIAPNFTSDSAKEPSIDGISLLMIEVQPILEEKTLEPDRVKDVWRLLREGVRGDAKPADMIKGFFKRVVEPADQDELHDSWQFDIAPDHTPGKRPSRYYAVVRGKDVHELVSLPLPWRIDLHEQHWLGDPIIDLLVDKSFTKTGVRSSVVVRDGDYGGLIAFIANGAIGLAGEMIRARPELEGVALDMLGAKSKSPLGACAAAYVLLATREWTADEAALEQPWQQWIRNLETEPLYNWIPDAAILCARMVLQSAETPEQARQAIPYLHRALRNGLPFYALGYRWLLEAMRFCREDPLIESVYSDVDRVGRYVDTSQTFIVLQLSAQNP